MSSKKDTKIISLVQIRKYQQTKIKANATPLNKMTMPHSKFHPLISTLNPPNPFLTQVTEYLSITSVNQKVYLKTRTFYTNKNGEILRENGNLTF